MNQIYESPLPLLLLGLVLLAGCTVGWLKTGDKRLIFGSLLGLLIAVGGILVERMVVTDREQIERVIYTVAADVQAGRIEEAVSHLNPDAGELRERARTELRLYRVTDIRVKRPIEMTLMPEREPTHATAEFNVVVTGGDATGTIQNQNVPRYLIVHFLKKDGRWYADEYEHHDPLYGMRENRR
ncbi:MAG: hypothetical protein U0939_22950 [Pirellulales bacterium]